MVCYFRVFPTGTFSRLSRGLITGTPTATTGPDGISIEVQVTDSRGQPPVADCLAIVVSQSSAPLAGVTQIVGNPEGGDICAVLVGGGVDCWGNNASGQLGNGSTVTSYVPVPVLGVSGIGTLAGVTYLASDGAGYSAVISIGRGSIARCSNFLTMSWSLAQANRSVPVQVEGVGGGLLSGVRTIVTDGIFDGLAQFWSPPMSIVGVLTGQVGWEMERSRTLPCQSLCRDWMASVCCLALRAWLAMARMTVIVRLFNSGEVACWGYNRYGELGSGTTDTRTWPVPVVRGRWYRCPLKRSVRHRQWSGNGYSAVLSTGDVDCWGVDSLSKLAMEARQIARGLSQSRGSVGSESWVASKLLRRRRLRVLRSVDIRRR